MATKLEHRKPHLLQHNYLVLFDGVCNLCNSSVDFIIKRERGDVLKFASLQSEVGQKIIMDYDKSQLLDSIVFLEKGKFYTQSTAALRLTKYLRFPYPLLQVLLIVPSFIRNSVYRLIAANRYKWFGKKETCRLPTAAERAKFLG